MKKYIVLMAACFCSFNLAYSEQDGSYHYEPPQGQRLELPQFPTIRHQEYQPRQQQQHQFFPRQYQQQQRVYQPQAQAQPQPQQYQHHQQHQHQQQRNYQHRYPHRQSIPLTMFLTSQGYSSPLTTEQESESDSVRLPLPLGVASINVGPLPLSRGVTYSDRPGVTSYGTTYPGRIR